MPRFMVVACRKAVCACLPLVGLAAVLASPARASAPPDFNLVAVAGSRSIGTDYAWIHINASGQAEFAVQRADTLTAAPLDTLAFTLTSGQRDSLWQEIQDQGFFSLLASYEDTTSLDGPIVQITVTGDSTTWTVTAINADVAALDSIVAAINRLTPGAHDLEGEYSPPAAYTPQDGCGNTTPAFAVSPWSFSARPGSGPAGATRVPGMPGGDSDGRAKLADQPGIDEARSARREAVNVVDAPHPGTTIAYHMSIDDALNLGIATVTSKGGFNGDVASLTVDNTAGNTTNDLRADLYLDLYGPSANATTAAGVSSAIEKAWGGQQTSQGQPMNVKVHNQVWPGVTNPPGTFGFHQILLGEPQTTPAVGRSFVKPIGTVNQGTTQGAWSDLPLIGTTIRVYAHEAGHLMGLPDHYTNYVKQPDGSWSADGGKTTTTSAQLAAQLQPRFPGWTLAQIQAQLDKPDTPWTTVPWSGYDNDLMATVYGEPRQDEIDALASQAGLVVDVPAGTVLANKYTAAQNLLTLRETHILVPKGQVRTIYGLWTACIDLHRRVPIAGVGFDVAPPLSQWTDSAAAGAMALQKLVDYINAQSLFCDQEAQFAIWDLTDGSPPTSTDTALFAAAGVSLPLPTGLPHFTDPAAAEPGSQLVQLYIPTITMASPDIVSAGRTVGLTATAVMGPPAGTTLALGWSVNGPPGSTATPSSASGAASTLAPDLPGTYRMQLAVGVTSPGGTSSVNTTRDLMCANEFTETFESGAVQSSGPFHWVTGGDSSWVAYSGFSHTGLHSAVAPKLPSTASSSLSTTLTLALPGTLEFAYTVSALAPGSMLRILVDGTVAATYQNALVWTIAHVALPAGTHTLTWNLLQGSPGTVQDQAAIDDIVFPPGTHLAGVDSNPRLPAVATLGSCWPNPVATEATISFALPRPGHVRIALYDLQGREVARLADGDFAAGRHPVNLDATGLRPGVYSLRFRSEGRTDQRRVVVVR